MEKQTVEQLLNSLAALVSDARGSLFGQDKVMVDRDRLLELVDALRAQMPAEISEAKAVVDNCSALRNNAKQDAAETRKKADELLRDAENRAAKLIEETTIVELAKKREQEILTGAQQQRDMLISGAVQYADKIMEEAQNAVTSTVDALGKGMVILREQAEKEMDVSLGELAKARKALQNAEKDAPKDA